MTPSQMELELEALRKEVTALKERSRARAPAWPSLWLAAGIMGLVLVTWSERALSAACATGLICFSAGTPAKADDINDNFDIVKKWIEAKVGAIPAGAPGAPSSSTVSTGALTASSATVMGLTDLKGSARYDCDGCGSASQLEGSENWGALTIQGRVLSANGNIHLSPPGGLGVVINDDFRAAGGTSTAAGASLSVEGPVMAQRFAPQWDSGWVAVSSNSNYTWAHGLGSVPSFVMLQTCGAVSGGNCTTRVALSGPSGFNDGISCINPITMNSDATNVYISTSNCSVWGYWVAGSGWTYTGDADNNTTTGFYRVLAWR